MSTGTVTSLWHVEGHILACRRAHLLFYTLLSFRPNLLFGIEGRCFGMWTGTFTSFLAWPRAHLRCFGMSMGTFWHVDGHTYYFTLHFTILPLPTFWHRGRPFGMSTGTFTTLLFTSLPFQPTFWHRGASLWHFDGHFTLYYSPLPTYFLASPGVFLPCGRAHLRRF